VFAKILDSMGEGNQIWAKHAPVLLLSVGKNVFSPGPYASQRNPYALHDTGAASAYISLQASALGLHAHGIGGFDHDKARQHFNIPSKFEIGACWAIGYLGDPDTLPDNLKERELKPRLRKSIAEFVFADWEAPVVL